jgi:hypothetical protein
VALALVWEEQGESDCEVFRRDKEVCGRVSITGKADGKSPNADKEIGRLKIVRGKGSLQHYRNDSTFKTYWTTTYQQELNTQGVR